MKRYQQGEMWASPYLNYLRQDESGDSSEQLVYKFKFFKINDIALRKLTYVYYEKMSWFEAIKNAEEDGKTEELEFPWIKLQLAWIGKKYDVTHWISHERHIELKRELEDFLQSYSGEGYMPMEKKRRFKEVIKEYANTCRPKHKAAQKQSSCRTVNEALKDWGYPYRIESKKCSRNGYQGNYLRVVKM